MDFLTGAGRFLDATSLLLVGGGTLLLAAARSTRQDLKGALGAIRPLLRGDPARDALQAARALRAISLITETRGVAAADRIDTPNAFARRAALALADAPSAEAFAAWGQAELEGRARRHGAVIGVWRAAADGAPVMGMIGTVIGLVGMFATMEEVARIGAFMAIAMLTTLYGLVLGAGIAGPVAARLERLSAAERAWQSDLVAGLLGLAKAQGDAEWLLQRQRTRA